MSNPDPSVPALGALDTATRARLDEGARGDAPIVYLRMEDFRALLAAYDAQAQEIEREQYDQTLRNAEERVHFALELAGTAEAERDQARAELDEHRIAYTALVGERDHEQVARKAAEAQMIRANMRAHAAEARATRLAALEEAAREIAILWPSDPQLWAWEEVEALVDAVARLAAPPGEGA